MICSGFNSVFCVFCIANNATYIGRVSLLEAKEANMLYCFFIQLLLHILKPMLFCDKLVIIIYMMTVRFLCCDAKTNHYFVTKINYTLDCDEREIGINRL